jgi:hypothetical protein
MNSINAMGIAVAVLVQCNEVSDFDLSHPSCTAAEKSKDWNWQGSNPSLVSLAEQLLLNKTFLLFSI